MNMDSRRLSILSAEEVEALYSLPRFTEDDRHLYFDLSAAAECEAVAAIHTVSVAMHLTLQLGYFKAKRQFFAYEQDVVLEGVRNRYSHDPSRRTLPLLVSRCRAH